MKVTEHKTQCFKEPIPRPKRLEDGAGSKKPRSLTKTDISTNKELSEADKKSAKLFEEIRAMKIALIEYQVKESRWRQEDRAWLIQKEAELMKKLTEFEEITKRVLKFVRLTDSVMLKEGNREVAERASLLSVASKRNRDGEGGEIVGMSASDLHLTDSEIYQELKDADDAACKTAEEIRAIKLAISKYHESKENSTWMKEDTFWLEDRQTELMKKLAEFEEVTRKFLRFIGLADISGTQFALPEETPRSMSGKDVVLPEETFRSKDVKDVVLPEKTSRSKGAKDVVLSKEMPKNVAAIEVLLSEETFGNAAAEETPGNVAVKDVVLAERASGNLVAELVVLAEMNTVNCEDEESSVAGSTFSGDTLYSRNIHQTIKEADEEACKKAQEIRNIKIEIANYHKQKENCKPQEEDKIWLERKKSELIVKLEDFEDISNKVKNLVSLIDVAETKSLSIRKHSRSDATLESESDAGSWVKFMVEQFFYGLNLVYYP